MGDNIADASDSKDVDTLQMGASVNTIIHVPILHVSNVLINYAMSYSYMSRLTVWVAVNRILHKNHFMVYYAHYSNKYYTVTWHSMHRQLSLMLHVKPSSAAASLYSSVLDFRRSFRRVLLTRRPSFFLLPPSSRGDELAEFPLLLAATSALPAGDPNRLTKPSTSCNER